MPNPGRFENAYDKARGLDPLPPEMLEPDKVPPPGTPQVWRGQKNALANRLMDMIQNPKNAFKSQTPKK